MNVIQEQIKHKINPSESYVIGLSGGVDSAVLAHAVHSIAKNVRSVFINHNQLDSDNLQYHAEKLAKELGIDHKSIPTKLKIESSETVMRDTRYNLLFAELKKDEILLLGHHSDDRVESFFINLLRGTRLKGLISIPEKGNRMLRPLINSNKNEILEYANNFELTFKNDESNNDLKISRNWIRNYFIPETQKRFSGELNLKVQNLMLEIENSLEFNKEFSKYIKCANGYFEVPIALINEHDSRSNFLLSIISTLIGQDGLQSSDLKKIFLAKNTITKTSYYQDWSVSSQNGLLVFINKKNWSKTTDLMEEKGYFKFEFQNQVDVNNNWNFNCSSEFIEKFTLEPLFPGDKMFTNGKYQKVSEILRGYGINSALREVWPILKFDKKVYWIPGLRKSDEIKQFESKKKNLIIVSSVEKRSIEYI